MKRNFTLTAIAGVALLTVFPSFVFSPTCMMGIAQCVLVQGEMLLIRDVETMAENCRDFTRRNLGAAVLRMSQKEILDRAGKNLRHPLLRASFAYDALHDSPLQFDRSLSIDQRYFPVKRACVLVFRAVHQTVPSDED